MQIEELKDFNKDFHEVMSLLYNWWGPLKNKSLLEITKEYQNILFKNHLPKIFILKENNIIIGLYELNEHDNIPQKEYTPFLANVFIKEEYRGHGYSRILISSAINETKKLGYHKLYLHSRHINFYEKYGFNYLETIDTIYGPKRIFIYEIKE